MITNASITPFIPPLIKALDKVSRELVGAISSVTRDMSAESAGIGQEIRFPIVPPSKAGDLVPGQMPTTSSDAIVPRYLKITKCRYADPICWTGNDQVLVGNSLSSMMQNQIEQSMRVLVNEVETDLCNAIAAAAIGAGSTVGTAGTSPFKDNINMLSAARKKLLDNGAPLGNLQCVVNTSDGMALRNLKQLQEVDTSGDTSLLRQGLLGNLMGFAMRESAGYGAHTAGTGTGYKTNGAAKAGATKLTLDSGTGALKAGDFIKFGSDDTRYVLAKDFAGTAGDIEIVSPLQKDVDDKAAVTSYGNYNCSAAFDQSTVWLATRSTPIPQGGDTAKDAYVVSDPRSGLSMTAGLYPDFMMNKILISLAWGVGVIKPEHTVAILG